MRYELSVRSSSGSSSTAVARKYTLSVSGRKKDLITAVNHGGGRRARTLRIARESGRFNGRRNVCGVFRAARASERMRARATRTSGSKLTFNRSGATRA